MGPTAVLSSRPASFVLSPRPILARVDPGGGCLWWGASVLALTSGDIHRPGYRAAVQWFQRPVVGTRPVDVAEFLRRKKSEKMFVFRGLLLLWVCWCECLRNLLRWGTMLTSCCILRIFTILATLTFLNHTTNFRWVPDFTYLCQFVINTRIGIFLWFQ